jgi:hypothetical protein
MGEGPGQDDCTSPYIEGYRGISGRRVVRVD